MRKRAVFVFPIQPDGLVLLHPDSDTHMPDRLVTEYENGERHYLIADVKSHDPGKSKPFAPEQLKSEPVADWVQEIMGRMELI